MRTLYFFLVLLFILDACKEKDELKTNMIVYSNLNPTVKLNTVNSFVLNDYGICYTNTPSPSDSSTFFDIDVDSDSIKDFRFTVRHFNWTLVNQNQYCGHCAKYLFDIQISGLTKFDLISIAQINSEPKTYDTLSLITSREYWNSYEVLYLQGGCSIENFSFKDSYIGIKHNNKIGWIHVMPFGNNGIDIMGYAINSIEYVSIKAGQKQ